MTHGSGSASCRSPRAAARESSASAVALAICPADSGVRAVQDTGTSCCGASASRPCRTAATDRAPFSGERVISSMTERTSFPASTRARMASRSAGRWCSL